MKILITGNMGYVGSVLAAHLRRRFETASITGVDAGWFAHCLTSRAALPETALDEQWFRDVRMLRAEDLAGFDTVIHLAAVSNDPMGKRFEAVTDAINHQASVHVATLAAEAGVRSFVFASSCSIYGFAADGRARTESDPVNPLTAYARSKIVTEESLERLERRGMTVTCLRFATACGMSDRLRLDLVVNDFVASALATGEVRILSDGTPWRPLIHVKDMARAMEWAITRKPEQGGEVLKVNVGADGWNYQVSALAEAVCAAIPGSTMSVNPDSPPDKRSYRVDFGLFRQLAPDHQPLETLAGTIEGLRDGLAAIGFADRNFRESGLIRLHVLEHLQSTGALDANLLRARWAR